MTRRHSFVEPTRDQSNRRALRAHGSAGARPRLKISALPERRPSNQLPARWMPRGHCSGCLQAECLFGDTFRSGRGRTITSIGSMRPRIATVRRSTRSVVMPADSAVATLTITSPAAAADASRAVMLTASPSAVKSSTVVPSPVAPTNASPLWTAVPTGMASAGVVLARAARLARSIAAATAALTRLITIVEV